MEVKEVTWPGRTYIADRSIVEIKDLGKAFMDKMPATGAYLHRRHIPMDGAPAGLYFTWDTVTGTTDLAVGIPVRDASAVSEGYTAISLPECRALMLDFWGPYSDLKEGHEAIHKYAQDKGLKLKSPCVEEYITDPGTEPDPARLLTRLYYLIND